METVYFNQKTGEAKAPHASRSHWQKLKQEDNSTGFFEGCPAPVLYEGIWDEEQGLWLWQNPKTQKWEGIIYGQIGETDEGNFGEIDSLEVILV